ncbi:nicotinate-nucleotide adenylyltransferase [Litchfieldia salsa]|uniref:Probable nicotinate-nucleotide adenylyltransferase n=1 Tax=Litchfieldia salsa TaxID=930152 RepID=A0A1H0V825_9BACI|nr:nicotinate-nucleotide adenylyltransferase [Litchfieldia salsa]SDP74692.1 nicotinate-nucleotide adenylyltransferase [Litchfieldia salsa]
MKHIGIIGGTFDPIHNGHLLIANEVLCELSLDEVWFMPNHIPPHKVGKHLTDSIHRAKMISLAIEDHPAFFLQNIELERDGRSFTYDTISLLKEENTDTTFYFIIGGDMVEYLPNWYKIEELSKLVTFVGVKRPGFSLYSPYNVHEVEIPQFDVSSSMLRDRLLKNRSTKYLLPDLVRDYIEENQLYGQK